jgi:sulfur carrier protein ThiS adenylyltransferase
MQQFISLQEEMVVMTLDLHIRSRLSGKVVGIAGCGGLGSNCAVALARVGLGKLIIADFDIVEPSNLNRQYFFREHIGQKKSFALKHIIEGIDMDIVVEAHDTRLNASNIPVVFKDCDVIVEAFDTAEMKQMIIETVTSEMGGKPLVCGVGLAGWGHSEDITLKRYGDIYICGDQVTETSNELPPLAARVGIVANMQANVVLELLLGKMK